MSNNGKPQQSTKLVAEIKIQWKIGAQAPDHLEMPKNVSAATVVGMLEWAKKAVQEQAVGRAEPSRLVRP